MSLIAVNLPGHASIEERLQCARRALALIIAAGTADLESANTEAEDVLDAIEGLADDVRRVLEPLRGAPVEVLNWCPATANRTEK